MRLVVLGGLCLLLVLPTPAQAKSPRADLKIGAVAASAASVTAGGTLSVRAVVRNAGARRAARSKAGFFLSRDDRRSGDDARLASGVRTKALKPRKRVTLQRTLPVPALLRGNFRLVVCADVGRRVRERREGNNCRAAKAALVVSAQTPAITVPPTATGGSVTGVEDTPVTITLGAGDPDTCELAFAVGVAPAHGTLGPITAWPCGGGGDTATVVYTPADDYAGADSFSFAVTDGTGGSSSASVSISLAAVNDLPRITTSSGSATWSEGGPAVTADPGVVVVDPDSAMLTGARVTIGSAAAGDELLFTNQNGITGNFAAATLTLTGAATVAQYQAALRSVTYRSTAGNPTAGARSIAFRASDAAGEGAAGSRGVAMNVVDDAPVLTTSGGAAAYTEGGSDVDVDPGVTVSDSDSPTLTGATVQITANGSPGEDMLLFTDQNGINGTFVAGTGTLTLRGAAPPAQYQAALRSVQYRNTSDTPSTLTRTISFRVNDETSNSGTGTRTVTVAAINDTPTVTTSAGAVGYTEGAAPVVIDGGLTVADPDDASIESASVAVTTGRQTGDTLNFTNQSGITGSFNAGTGVLTLSGTATVAQYQGALRSVTFSTARTDLADGTRTIAVSVNDGSDTSTAATRALNFTAINAAPVVTASGGSAGFTEGGAAVAVDTNLTVNDADDPNLNQATVTITAGLDTGDMLNFTNQNGITGNFVSGTLTLTGTATVAQYQAALRSVTFSNARQDLLNGSRTVTFTARDPGNATSAPVSRGVTVTHVDTPPTVTTTGGSSSYIENAAPSVVDAGLTLTDPDSTQIQGATVTITNPVAGDRLQFTDAAPITGSGSGTATIILSGTGTLAQYQTALRTITFSSTSDNPTSASRAVRFVATDTTNATSLATTKTVAVTPVNDAPAINLDVAGGLTYTENEGFVPLFGPAAAVTDPDSGTLDSLTVTLSTGFDATFDTLQMTTAGFTASFVGGALTITKAGGTSAEFTTALRNVQFRNTDDDPDDRNDGTPNAVNARTVSVVADDGPDTSAPTTRNITITPVNDAPSAPTPAPSVSSVRNTTLVSGANSVTGPKVTRTIDLKGNSTDPDGLESAITVVAANAAATAQSGRITLTAAGDVLYEPPASVTLASDTYGYQLTDGNTPTGTITFTVNLAGEVWYVADQAPLPRDGTAARPFDTLAGALAVATTNDAIHIRRAPGDGTLTGGVTLQAGQKLIGEGVALTNTDVGSGTAETLVAAGTKPVLTATGVDVVTLANSTEVAGLSINPDGAGGGLAGTSPTGVTARTTDITDTGTPASQPGIELTTGGGLTFSGTVSVSTIAARALDLTGTALSGTLASTSVSASTGGGVRLANTTGSLTVQALSITTTGGTGFLLSNATNVDVDGAGFATSVSSTGGPAVDATALTNGTDLVFDSVSASGAPAKGVNLDGTGGWTFSAAAGSISGATTVGFDVNGGSGAVSYAGNIANGNGEAVDVTGRTGNTTLSGNITGAGGTGVNVANNTAGTSTFSGTTKTLNTGTNQAVTLSSNTGHTINFTGGGLAVTTTSGAGFGATGGGTVTVQGTGNTINSGTGTALNVTSTTIGASGLTFQAIHANGATNGIVLNNTGASGSLTVTGLGSTTQGGDNSGGTIQATTGFGISLTSTAAPSFRNLRLLNTGDSGVNGTQVSGFAFTDGTITGAGDASDENSITFDDSLTSTPNLTGAVTVTNNVISQTEAEGIDIENWAGTITNATISNNALSDTGDVATPGSAITLIQSGLPASAGSITRATIANNTITDFRAGVGIQVRAGNPNAGGPAGNAGTPGSATDVIAVTGNAMNGGTGGIGNQPDRFFTGGVSGVGQGNLNVSNNGTAANRIRMIDCIAIEIQADAPATLTSTIQNNFINANSAVGCAGIAVGTDSTIGTTAAASHTTTISGNNVMGTDGPGIFPIVRNSASTMTAKVLNNTVAAPITTNAARAGIRVDSGSASGDTTLCLEISGNTTAGSTNSGTGTTSPGINLRKQGTDPNINTFGIEGMAATASPGVENYVNGLNTSTSGTFGTGGTALLSAASGFTNCTAP